MTALVTGYLLPIAAIADNEGACKRYATEAVRQNNQNIALEAGLSGPAWSSDYEGHYNWCVHGNNAQSTPLHMAGRERQLQEAAIRRLGKEQAAKRYADEAVRQFKASQEMMTGFTPPIWSGNFSSHYDWIVQDRNIESAPEHLADRESRLQHYAVEHGYQPAEPATGIGHVIDLFKQTSGGTESQPEKKAVVTPMNVGKAVEAVKPAEFGQSSRPLVGMAEFHGGKSGTASAMTKLSSWPIKLEKAVDPAQVSDVKAVFGQILQQLATGGHISGCDLVNISGREVTLTLHYEIKSANSEPVYVGAFLYDVSNQAVDAGYKPAVLQQLPHGSGKLTLVLPETPFQSSTIDTFLIRSGKVVVSQRFKLPFMWNGTTGVIATAEH
jgi:hypothetical protein